ncbi:hypothetical protein WR25_11739 [Diploscapter pachys]|uniref:RRM domain-containing protein n=1 Tax=Diploscapter pachys TaxID=2018661 RepID=A0A2A2KPA2_9BILA|nr:hypothetical protein WR25_11739 [Diploscapter pachys]
MRDVADPIMPEDIHKFLIDNKEAIIAFLQNIPSETSGQARKARSIRIETKTIPVSISYPVTASNGEKSKTEEQKRTRSRSGSYSSRTVQHPKNSSEPRRYYNSHTSNGSASHGSRRGREHRDPTGPRSTVIATEGFEAARWRSPRRNSPSRRRPSTYASSTRAAPPSRCLGVFGMNPSTNERDLNSIFSEFGRVEQVKGAGMKMFKADF